MCVLHKSAYPSFSNGNICCKQHLYWFSVHVCTHANHYCSYFMLVTFSNPHNSSLGTTLTGTLKMVEVRHGELQSLTQGCDVDNIKIRARTLVANREGHNSLKKKAFTQSPIVLHKAAQLWCCSPNPRVIVHVVSTHVFFFSVHMNLGEHVGRECQGSSQIGP